MRHDPERIKRAKRSGRERGAWIYVPAEHLAAVNRADAADGGAPFYRTFPGKRGGVAITFYDRARPPALPGRKPREAGS